MGFGILFIGYLFLYSLNYNGFDILPDFVGFVIMLAAFYTLCKYSERFKTVRAASVAGIVLSLAKLLWQVIGMPTDEAPFIALSYVYTVFTAVFFMLLTLAVFNIASDVGVNKLMRFSLINTVVCPLFVIAAGVCGEVARRLAEDSVWAPRLNTTASLLMIISLILNTLLIFNCYAKICLEGDENMDAPEKKSRILKNPIDYIEKARKSSEEYLKTKSKNKKK